MIDIIGRPPIHPLLFYSGKLAGFVVWILLFRALISIKSISEIDLLTGLAVMLLCLALLLIILSSITLGTSIRVGLPKEKSRLITGGLYKISRNPIYLGFDLLTLSALLILHEPLLFGLGLYSVFIYHLIILGEEKFLERRFKKSYLEYKTRVGRYL